jgi:hypothetical protein
MQNSPVSLRINVDNRNAGKAVTMIRLQLHREIKVTGRNIAGQEVLFEDKQVVGVTE